MQYTTAYQALIDKLLAKQSDVEAWFREQWQKTRPPFYGSVDLRNAGFKIAPVDTNLFPAGFNNLNPKDMPLYVQAVQATFAECCPEATRLLLIPESHTRNVFYFESLFMLKSILVNAGFEVRVATMAESIKEPTKIDLPSGRELLLEPLIRKGDKVGVENFSSCCIVLNNDLSNGVPEILQGLNQTIMPSIKLGWSTRLKSEHFRFYQSAVEDFAKTIEIDPWLLSPLFDQCPEVDFMKKEGEQCLVSRAKFVLEQIKEKYSEYNIRHEPFLVIKADKGTYGMAVMMIRDPEELAKLNRKQRTSMSTIKGGVPVTKAIIQEGVYSFETVKEGAIAEPVVYSIGRHVIGGFYRVHKNRGPDENLNAPGMDFQPLPFKQPCLLPDLKNKYKNPYYIYGVVARLAIVAAAREIASFSDKESSE